METLEDFYNSFSFFQIETLDDLKTTLAEIRTNPSKNEKVAKYIDRLERKIKKIEDGEASIKLQVEYRCERFARRGITRKEAREFLDDVISLMCENERKAKKVRKFIAKTERGIAHLSKPPDA